MKRSEAMDKLRELSRHSDTSKYFPLLVAARDLLNAEEDLPWKVAAPGVGVVACFLYRDEAIRYMGTALWADATTTGPTQPVDHDEDEQTESKYIDIVFDGPPSHESGRFVEVENSDGQSIKYGEWVERSDGLWALRIVNQEQPPEGFPSWAGLQNIIADKYLANVAKLVQAVERIQERHLVPLSNQEGQYLLRMDLNDLYGALDKLKEQHNETK